MAVWKNFISICTFLFLMLTLSSCQSASGQAPMPYVPDLIIYTCQDESVSEPIIKEFGERTGLLVKTEYGSSSQLRKLLSEEDQKPAWDLVFGAGTEALEQTKEFWQPYNSSNSPFISASFQCDDYSFTTFSAMPLVIIYNTNVVTYRELPTGWESLLEPRWKGRVAFGDPVSSDIYASALAAAVHTCHEKPDYLERLVENPDYSSLMSLSEVNAAVTDGRYSIGVTLEGFAQSLSASGAEIDYIYPEEGTVALPDGSAIIKECTHLDAAKQFIDFTVSKDAQQLLVSHLNRRSVRIDVTPAKGLSSIYGLPLVDYNLTELSAEKEAALSRWNILLQAAERRASR